MFFFVAYSKIGYWHRLCFNLDEGFRIIIDILDYINGIGNRCMFAPVSIPAYNYIYKQQLVQTDCEDAVKAL